MKNAYASLAYTKNKFMNHIPVESSNIESIAHDGTTLEVKFKNGGIYSYANVPLEKFEALKNAESIGLHFHQHIKPHHPATKLKAR